jgi:NAD(P)-dependent dehydrogenase (short-subunit alcohol dehydrogenase family)
MRLKGKTAIITGASSGMGKATALLFAAEGANVIAIARRKERLEEIATHAKENGQIIVPVEGDVTVQADIEKAVKLAADNYSGVDILVNNAGVMDNMVPIADLDDDLWTRMLDVNLTSVMKFTRAAIREMLKKESGVIVNIASVGGTQGSRAGVAYTAAKHAVIGLTKNVGFQYALRGIRCNAICPGGVATEIAVGITDPNLFGMERATAGLNLMPRQGEAEEIASIALFLASDDASFVNGAVLAADGGWTAY